MALSGVPPNLFFAGLCWLLTSFIRDISNDLDNFTMHRKSQRNPRQMKIKLCEILRDLSKVKRLSTTIRMVEVLP